MIIIGVTGAMGSGKSTVCRIFGELGAAVLEADVIAKGLYEKEPELKRQIIEAFGTEVLSDDGKVDFKALAGAAFDGRKSAYLLNGIVHPYIRDELRRLIMHLGISNEVIVVDAALLFEGKLLYTVDYIITVTAPEEVRIKRLIGSGRFTEDEIRRRSALQFDEKEKAERADYVIENDGRIEDLHKKVAEILDKITK